MRFLFIYAIFLITLPCFAEESVHIDGVAAYVNEHVLTIGDVLAGSRELQEQMARSQGADFPKLNKLYIKALDNVIADKLILDQYSDQKDFTLPEAAVDEKIESIIHNLFNDDRGLLLKELGRDGLTMTTWRNKIRNNIITRIMRNHHVDSKISVSPTDVRARYVEEKDKYSSPARLKISMIVLMMGDGETAEKDLAANIAEVQKYIADGNDFAEVAKKHSKGSRANDGGSRGWMNADMLRKELAEIALKIEIGSVSEPVQIGDSAYLLKVEDREDARILPFEEAQKDIERQLHTEAGKRLYDMWISHLKTNAYIKIIANKPFDK